MEINDIQKEIGTSTVPMHLKELLRAFYCIRDWERNVPSSKETINKHSD